MEAACLLPPDHTINSSSHTQKRPGTKINKSIHFLLLRDILALQRGKPSAGRNPNYLVNCHQGLYSANSATPCSLPICSNQTDFEHQLDAIIKFLGEGTIGSVFNPKKDILGMAEQPQTNQLCAYVIGGKYGMADSVGNSLLDWDVIGQNCIILMEIHIFPNLI